MIIHGHLLQKENRISFLRQLKKYPLPTEVLDCALEYRLVQDLANKWIVPPLLTVRLQLAMVCMIFLVEYRWLQTGGRLYLILYSDLNYHTDYYGKVSRGAKDLAGNPLVNDYIWKFSTDKGEGNTPSDQEHKSDTPSSGNGKDDSGEILGKKNVGVLNLNLEMKIVLPIDDDSIKSLSLSKKNQKPGSLSDADIGNEQIQG